MPVPEVGPFGSVASSSERKERDLEDIESLIDKRLITRRRVTNRRRLTRVYFRNRKASDFETIELRMRLFLHRRVQGYL